MHKYITLFLFVVLVIGVLLCMLNGGAIERFIVTIDEIALKPACPDYLITDGANFYLVWNNLVMDGVNNPVVFPKLSDAHSYLEQKGCPRLEAIPLRRITNLSDPTVSYERECSVQTANPNYWVGRCVFDKIFSAGEIEGGATLTAEDLAGLRPDVIAGLDKNKIKKGEIALSGDAYGYVRRVNDAIANMETGDLVNYDIETCMYDKLAKDMPGIGSAEGLQKFRRYYNQKLASTVARRPDQDNVDLALDPSALGDFNKYFDEANNVSITNNMMDQLFGATTST